MSTITSHHIILYHRITGIRKAPQMTSENWKELSPVGLWAALAHAFSVLALGAGMHVYPILSYPLNCLPFFSS